MDAGTNGTIYFDDFESRRFSYIGTLTDPGVNDPQATNAAGWTASTYQYSTTIPHAVTSVAIEGGGTNSYEYDDNGNMTCRVEGGVTFKQTYNAENRISTIQKLASGTCASPGNLTAHWAFAYDGDGTRVSTLYTPYVGGAPQTSVLTAYYMGGAYEVTGSAVKKYYSVAGMMVAVNDGTGLQYLLTDHLGSTVAVTNSSGTLTSQQRYLPFGAPRTIPNSPILATDFTYTGQRKLDDGMGGIMDYKARFYSPALSRFLQPDTIIPGVVNPQAWNRYSYTLGNPIKYGDPSGHGVDCGIGMDCAFDPPTPTPLVDPPDDDAEPSFEYSDDLIYSFDIGPSSDEYIVEYYGDLPTDDMLGPNACRGKGRNPIAPIFCGISIFMSFPSIGNAQGNYEANFWIHLSVNYSELHGSINVSNLSVSSTYDGIAMLKSLDVQSGDIAHTIYSTPYNYPMHPGFGSTTIPDSGGVFYSTNSINYEAEINYSVDTGNGPFDMPQTLNIRLPSLYELKNQVTNLFFP